MTDILSEMADCRRVAHHGISRVQGLTSILIVNFERE
jgi:hypothetical protein